MSEDQAVRRNLGFKLGNHRRNSVSTANPVMIEKLNEESDLPVVISPQIPDVILASWAENNRDQINELLNKHGAVLFRGFNITNVENFENVVSKFCDQLFNENGEHPRISSNGNVYKPVFYPPDKQLLWHNENSFNFRFPGKIMFGCKLPATKGGETPLVDSRLVYQSIDPSIRKMFEEKNVMYVRNYSAGLGLQWETVFNTNDKSLVEEECKKSYLTYKWKNDNNLRTSCIRPAVISHPVTKEKSWFNQAQHWHISCLDKETYGVFTRSFKDEDLPRNCYFGDGSIIEDSIMNEILAIYGELEVVYSWQQGDVVLIDNILTAHGRNPFQGERKLFVALGDMLTFDHFG